MATSKQANKKNKVSSEETQDKKTTAKDIANIESSEKAEEVRSVESPNRQKRVEDYLRSNPNTEFEVKSNCYGGLIFVSKKTGGRFEWNTFGEVQYMLYSDLLNLKAESRKFYEDNLIIPLGIKIDNELVSTYDILKSLRVDGYYKNYVDLDNIADLMDKDISIIKATLTNIPSSAKDAVAGSISALVKDGKIDSYKKIGCAEEALGVSILDKKE